MSDSICSRPASTVHGAGRFRRPIGAQRRADRRRAWDRTGCSRSCPAPPRPARRARTHPAPWPRSRRAAARRERASGGPHGQPASWASTRSLTPASSLASQLQQQIVLIFEVFEDHLDLLLGLNIDLEVVLGAGLGVGALDVLPDHDQRHQQDLNDVGDEQIEDEAHRRIEPHRLRREQVPAQPDHRPGEDDQEEPHGADPFGDEHRELD